MRPGPRLSRRPGPPRAQVLRNRTFPLSADLALGFLRSVAAGMRFLHAARPAVLHGDLKSSNVLVDARLSAKISDFGQAPARPLAPPASSFVPYPSDSSIALLPLYRTALALSPSRPGARRAHRPPREMGRGDAHADGGRGSRRGWWTGDGRTRRGWRGRRRSCLRGGGARPGRRTCTPSARWCTRCTRGSRPSAATTRTQWRPRLPCGEGNWACRCHPAAPCRCAQAPRRPRQPRAAASRRGHAGRELRSIPARTMGGIGSTRAAGVTAISLAVKVQAMPPVRWHART